MSMKDNGRGRVEFDEPSHKYWYPPDDYYISGTTVISLLKADKDWDAIASNYARKNGGTKDYWLKLWKLEADKGKKKGTFEHGLREKKIIEVGGLMEKGERYPNFDHSRTVSLHDLPVGKNLIELRLWCHYCKIAGTADVVNIHRDKSISVFDWKTNKEIKCETKWDRASGKVIYRPYNYISERTGQPVVNSYMKAPLDHLVDTEYNHYALQLSLYAWMMELEGFTVRELAFIHTTNKNKVYHCPYMRSEIMKLVSWYTY